MLRRWQTARGGHSGGVAGYRLAHEEIGWDEGLQAHEQAALGRVSAEAVVLCLQDTTELDDQGRAMQGLGT